MNQREDSLDAAGLSKRRDVLGDAYVNLTLEWADAVGAWDFQRLLTKFCWGEVWQRNVLSDRDRSLLCLGILIASGKSFELTQHLRAARRNGLSEKEIFEVILFTVPYVGIPSALEALKLWAPSGREQEQHSGRADMNDIRETFATLVKNMTGIQREVADEDLLQDDLGLSSIDYVEIACFYKERWGVKVTVDRLRDCERFADLVALADPTTS